MLKIRVKRLKKNSALGARLLKRIAAKTLHSHGITRGELGLLFVSDAKIRSMNIKYLGRDCPTDVLSFSMREGKHMPGSKGILGDVVISVDRARAQARRFNNTLKKELALYLIHGILHLIGYKDGSKKIKNTEEKLLKEFF